MAGIRGGVSAALVNVGATNLALNTSLRAIEGTRYRLAQQSGLITVVAAATASAGHLFAFRWSSAAGVCLVHRVRAKWATVAGFTAAQEIGIDLIRATGYSASHTSGTAATLTGVNLKRRQSMAASALADARISATGALTAGTHTFDANAMAFDSFSELAAAATVAKGQMVVELDAQMDFGGPLELATNEGFVIRNTILMGAGGTARLTVEVDWTEVGTGVAY